MSNTRIGDILNARKSANSRSLRVKAEDLSLYNEYKASLNNSKIKINLRNNSIIEVNLMNYLTLECYDEYDSYVSTGIVYFGNDGENTYSILGLIDIEELLSDNNLTINDVSDVSVHIYSRRGLYNLPFEIYGIDTFYLSTYISGGGEYIIPLLDIYNSDNDSTFFITPLSLFNDYDIIYDLDSNAEIDRTFYPVELLITHAPNKTTYNETEYFDDDGMVVKLKYSDNSLIEVNDYVCTPQGRLYIENNYISVNHSGLTAYQAVTVNETLISLRIDEYPRTNYLVGESFDRTGLKLIGVYPNNIEREITDYLVSPNTPLNTSNTVVTLTKGTKSINLNISVRYLYDFLTKTYNNSYISLFDNISFNPVTKTHIFSLNLLESNSNFLNIDIGLIYRSISTFAHDIIFNTIENNFKLSVDERIVKHDTLAYSYKHIDSNGDVHEFTPFDIDTGSIKRYYDSYNANIVLEVDTVNNLYNLKYDNYTKVFNSNGYLINIIDKYNKRIIYTYDNKNRLSQVYSETSTTNRYSFDYDGLDHLTSITQKVNNNQYKKIYFYYDSSYKLIKIEKKVKHSNTFISSNCLGFLYDSATNKLSYILDKKNNSAYHYLYDNNHEIYKIETGTTTNETAVSISNTTFNTFFNERDYKELKVITPRDEYSIKNVKIENKLGTVNVYEFDKNNEITSSFSLSDITSLIYRVPNSREGKCVHIVDSIGTGGIANKEIITSSNEIYITPFNSGIIDSGSIDSNKTYYFNLSFYLKLNSDISSLSKVKLYINESNNNIHTHYLRINEKALGTYQLINIPFYVKGSYILNINRSNPSLSILDYGNNYISSTISDVRIKKGDITSIYYNNNNLSNILNNSQTIEYKLFDLIDDHPYTTTVTKSLNLFRIYESDILNYLTKRGEINDSNATFDFVYDNSKKRIGGIISLSVLVGTPKLTIASNTISQLKRFRVETLNDYSSKNVYFEDIYQDSSYFKKTTEEVDYILKNSSNNDYIKRISKEYEYDSYDRIEKKEEFEKDININTQVETIARYNKTIYSYITNSSLISTEDFYEIIDNTITNTKTYDYTYDSNTLNLLSKTQSVLMDGNIDLVVVNEIDYSYDSYNNKTSETYYAYNDVSGVTPVKRCEFTYDDTYEYIKDISFKIKDGNTFTEIGKSTTLNNIESNESNTDISSNENKYTRYIFKNNYKQNKKSTHLHNNINESNITNTSLLFDNQISSNSNYFFDTTTIHNSNPSLNPYKLRKTYDKYNRLESISEYDYTEEDYINKAVFSYYTFNDSYLDKLTAFSDLYIEKITQVDDNETIREDTFKIKAESNYYEYSLSNISYLNVNYSDLNGKTVELINGTNNTSILDPNQSNNILSIYSKTNTYDNKDRLEKEESQEKEIIKEYEYDVFDRVTLEKYKKTINNTETLVLSIGYEYDDYGNIIKADRISHYNNNEEIIDEYEYDKAGRITKDESAYNGNYPINYSYSVTTGKRTKIYQSPIPSNNILYGLNGRISSFDGISLSYDNYGNITEIGALKDLSYTRGNLLETYIDNDYTNPKRLSFVYDYNGIRYQKKILDSNNNITKTITYYYQNNKLLFERIHNTTDGTSTTNDIVISYIYDDRGISGAIYKNHKYKYIKNILGDIILIVNESLDVICEYTYTAYGEYSLNDLSITNSIDSEFVNYNPFTYRGYYKDHESNLYYLINRYYSPDIEMFITPDSFNYLDPSTLYGLDLYTYCMFNPVMYVDPEGKFAISTIFWIIAGIAAVSSIAIIMYGATTETPVVLDISLSLGIGADIGIKGGLSMIIDFKNDVLSFYLHGGVFATIKWNLIGGSYSVGLISNYEKEEDYSGYFTDMGGGYLIGIDHCYNPEKQYDETTRASMITFGIDKGIYYGNDYYWHIGNIVLPRRINEKARIYNR